MLPPTQTQARVIWAAVTGLAIATLVGLVAGLIWAMGRLVGVFSSVLWPLAAAGILACLLDPVVDFFARRRVPRTRAIVIVFVMALVIVIGLLASIVPQLVLETHELALKMPAYKERIQRQAEHWIQSPPPLLRKFLKSPPAAEQVAPPPEAAASPSSPAGPEASPTAPATANPPTWQALEVRSASDWLAKTLPTVANWLAQVVGIIASVFGIIAGLALIPIYAFYFLLEKQGITAKWHDYLPVKDSRFKDELVFVLDAINQYIIAFFRGQVLVAVCDGVLYTLGFLLIGLPYAVLIGVLATGLTIIPVLGAITSLAIALIIALVGFGDWQHPLLVLAVFVVVQALEGTVIQPKIMGDRVGLHPVTILIALLVGTTLLGGLLGGILAIPLTATLRVVMGRYVWNAKREA